MLSREYKDYVDEIAEKVKLSALELLGMTMAEFKNTPENIRRVIECLGGEINPDISNGMRYESLGDGRFNIHCDFASTPVMDLAHELGHHCLLEKGNSQAGTIAWRRDLRGTNFFDDDADGREKAFYHELAVRYFERAFLMPKTEFKKSVEKYTIENKINIAKIAKDFGVPCQLVENRGNDFKLWDYRQESRQT